MLKVMTIVGTRPELIRLSRTIARLDRITDHVLVHTGQNYDSELNAFLFEDLCIRPPDVLLDVSTTSLGSVMAGVLTGTETALHEHKPDAVVVLGDTNSCIAALMARRNQVPVYHLEAGNRSFDANVPEEMNRRMVDHISDFNLAYTEHGRRNLLAEGIHPSQILVTGSPMREVLERQARTIDESRVLTDLGLEEDRYFVVSVHREENVDEPSRLDAVLETLRRLADEYEIPIVMSAHPRTMRRLVELDSPLTERLRVHRPFNFSDYIKLQRTARCVLSDSGTISEESAILNFPAVTLRPRIERPEALDAGSIITAGIDGDSVLDAVNIVTAEHAHRNVRHRPVEYEVSNFSERVVNFIRSTASTYHEAYGVRKRSDVWAGR